MTKYTLTTEQMLELSRRNEAMKKSVMEHINTGAGQLLYTNAILDDTELTALVSRYEQEAYAAYEAIIAQIRLIEATYSDTAHSEEEE